ncbi:XdhC family protein [bacterium]|nr:MAG: XdhC family protein [bacterium]
MHEREAILKLWSESEKAALATVVEVRGSAYRRPGARMLLTHEGRSAGVINGGCLDADIHARAQMVMEDGQPQLAIYDTTSSEDIVFGLGLGCRGVVKILIEPISNLEFLQDGATVEVRFEGEDCGTSLYSKEFTGRPQIIESGRNKAWVETIEPALPLLVFGAGADVVPLAALGKILGWNVQIRDLRAPSPARQVMVEASYLAPDSMLEKLQVPTGAACVIMTHNFLHDLELLKVLLSSKADYIGILGPRRRTVELLEKLGSDTLLPGMTPSEAQLEKLHGPIGLDLGAETPEEIALSIVAEIQMVKRAKSGAKLREMKAIH